MKEYEYIEHPNHYNAPGKKECIEEMIDTFGVKKVADWCEITAFKYDYRKGLKPDNSSEQDEKKAEWYRNKAKELRLQCIKKRLQRI